MAAHASPVIPWRPAFAVVAAFTLLLWLPSLAQDLLLYPDLTRKVWLLDVDYERGFFTWLSVNLLLAASCILLYTGREIARRKGRYVLHWHVLALIFLLLSVDEFSSLHEKLSDWLKAHMLNAGGIFYFAWAAPAGIGCLLGLVAYVPFIRSFPPRLALQLLLSAALFLGGAVGLEMWGGSVAETEGVMSLAYRLLANAEEGLEALGTLVFIHALLRYREASGLAEPR